MSGVSSRRLAVLATLALLPLAVAAQTTYRCTGKDGKKYYGQSVPAQCVGVAVEELNGSGTVVKRINVQAKADDQAQKEAAEAERRKQQTLAREQARRDQALLATYSSEKDVEDMRRRSLEDVQRFTAQIEAKIADLKGRVAKGDAAAGSELSMQEGLLETKKKEAQAINAKYDDDRKRYRELTAGQKK